MNIEYGEESKIDNLQATNEIQGLLIEEYAGDDVDKQLEWVKNNGERFRKITNSDETWLELWRKGKKDLVLRQLRQQLNDQNQKAA